jgi:hypothetical protein
MHDKVQELPRKAGLIARGPYKGLSLTRNRNDCLFIYKLCWQAHCWHKYSALALIHTRHNASLFRYKFIQQRTITLNRTDLWNKIFQISSKILKIAHRRGVKEKNERQLCKGDWDFRCVWIFGDLLICKFSLNFAFVHSKQL